jgi:mono/diheme cytochrome c family protein
MRPELEQIEKIEKYLNGELSAADKAAFELQLAEDPQLREDLRLHQDLMKGLDRIKQIQSVRRAKQHFQRTSWLRWGGFGLGLAAIAVAVFLLLTHQHSQPTAIPGESYTIDLTRDTVLKTAHGALIQIPRGSIDANGAPTIRLSIKEAYSIADMIRYSLTTQSNDQPLSSGGMIDIQPAPGNSARIVRPLTIKLPTNRVETNMQLFKGTLAGNGKINWTSPRPLADTTPQKDLAYGRSLFQTNCAQCHSPAYAVTGPSLAYIGERRSRTWLNSFIRNNQKVLASGDCYSRYIFNAYNKTAMNLFPNLTDRDIDQLLAYLDNESQLTDSKQVPDYKREFDSCRKYRQMEGILDQNRQALIDSNGIRTNVIRRDNTGVIITDTTVVYTDPAPVITIEHPSIYYTFTVESFGWYNVDALLKDLPGIEPSELRVHMTEEYAAEVNVFLIIPGRKILIEGGFLKDSKTDFGFLTEDARIPLPQREQAYVFATGEYQGKAVFEINSFITSTQQTINLQPEAMTKAQIAAILSHLDLNQLSIRVADSRNATRIRAIDTSLAAIARFKPRDCDCDCKLDGPGDISLDEQVK